VSGETRRQDAARCGTIGECRKKAAARRRVQVGQQAFADEQARPFRVVTGLRQYRADVVGPEGGRSQRDRRRLRAERLQTAGLVVLGIRMVEFKEPDA
jgi:hypothetical protein